LKNFTKALNYAFLLLKYRARSRHEIVSRLKEKGYSLVISGKVIGYLKENNYINDKKFTCLFVVNALDKDWGPVRIDSNLKKLGISVQLRKQALKENSDYTDRVRDIIEKRLEYYQKIKPNASVVKIWQKIVMYLVRKGFDYATINKEMDNLGRRRFED